MVQIKDLYRLQDIKRLRLVAGRNGLDRIVSAAVLFEYDTSRMKQLDYYRGDLVVTTLAYARGDINLVTESLLDLMNQGVSGLLVKTAYFAELPEAVTEAANRLDTPIFLFDDTFIELVILEVTELIRGKHRFSGYEQELDELIQGTLTVNEVRERVRKLMPSGIEEYRIFALIPDNLSEGLDEKIFTFSEANRSVVEKWVFLQYRQIMLAILFSREPGLETNLEELNALLALCDVNMQELTVGAGEIYSSIEEIGTALCEATYAARAGKIQNVRIMRERDAGIFSFIFPMCRDPIACAKSLKIMNRIRDYDAKNHTTLEQTTRVYVQNGADIGKAARLLFQHPNTIRYRIAKIRKILDMEYDERYEQILCIAVQIAIVLEKEGKV